MKHFLFGFAFLLCGIFATAQIVNIPDPVLKAHLIDPQNGHDSNHDGEIQVTEAEAVQTLVINASPAIVTDPTGIRAFINLKNLMLYSTLITSLDLNGFTQLESLQMIDDSLLTDLNINGCINLQGIDLRFTKVTNLDLRNFPAMASVFIQDDPNLMEFNVEGLQNLNTVWFTEVGNQQTIMNLKNCPALTEFFAMLSADTLDISGSQGIEEVHWFRYIGTLLARNCTGLKYIISGPASGTLQNSVDVTGCTNLEYFSIAGNYAETIDLSGCPRLTTVKFVVLHHNPTYLNLKNGVETFMTLSGMTNPANTLNICADYFEVDSINTILRHLAQPPTAAYVNDYCSFFPAGNYNTIKGAARVDINANGCDNNDFGVQHVPLRFTDNTGNSVVKFTGLHGKFNYYPNAGNFTVTPYFPYPYFTLTPATATSSFAVVANLVDSIDFCIHPSGVHNDVDITLLPAGAPPRLGGPVTYKLTYRNRGNTTLSGNMHLNYDNNRMLFSNSSYQPASQNTGEIIWNYSTLYPLETRSFDVVFQLHGLPVNNIGDTLIWLASIDPTTNDESIYNNSFVLPQLIVGSYDPNDKRCLQGSKIDIADAGKPLDYVINFQNLGTDTAFNVIIADVLEDKFDLNTIEITSASHACDIQLEGDNLRFYFNNIKLPQAAIDEPGSHGFVAFKIQPKNNVAIGDSLKNKAAIYFDFNAPVITNTVNTVITTAGPVAIRLLYFSISTKEETNLLVWKIADATVATDFTIQRSSDGIHFNNIGNITATAQRCLLPFNFTDNKPLNGKNYYRIKITDANSVSFYSKILVTGKTRSGFEIVAITSDQNNTILYLNVSKDQPLNMKIIAADGRMVYSQSKIITAGTNQLNIQTGNLAKGIYTLLVYTREGELITKRFLK